MLKRTTLAVGCFFLLYSSAWARSPDEYPVISSDHAKGREIWLGTCENCHGYGTAGAPIPMQPDDWQARLELKTGTLYSHAIEGFFGPGDTFMPPRGGNDSLSDEQVKAAVDYMVALARYYLKTTGEKK